MGFVHGETMGLPAKSIRIEGCPVNCLVNQFKASIYNYKYNIYIYILAHRSVII